MRFNCPRCQGICNCTHCCARRQEPYISARIGKLPPSGSAEALALSAAAAAAATASPTKQSAPRASTAKSKLGLVGGEYFGVIYGLTGERVGAGFVGSDNQGIVFGSRNQPKAVAYVGKPRKGAASSAHPIPPVVDAPLGDTSGVSQANAQPPHPSGAYPSISTSSVPLGDAPDPSASFNGTQPMLSAPVGSVPPARPRRMFVGDRAALDKSIYVPMDVLMSMIDAEHEEQQAQDRSQEWAAPSSDPAQGDGPSSDSQHAQGANSAPPSHDEVQWAIALALHALEVDAAQS